MPQVNWLRTAGLSLALLAALFVNVPPVIADDYIVQPGDNPTRIARRFGVNLDALLAANNLTPTTPIYAGQRLIIPETMPASIANAGAPPSTPAGTKGLAMATRHPEDLTALGVSWWYVWGWCPSTGSGQVPSTGSGCVPMVRAMELPLACPATLLVGNEPNAIEPYGAPVTPADAAARALAIEARCPGRSRRAWNWSMEMEHQRRRARCMRRSDQSGV